VGYTAITEAIKRGKRYHAKNKLLKKTAEKILIDI
jgi:hypothetical protein